MNKNNQNYCIYATFSSTNIHKQNKGWLSVIASIYLKSKPYNNDELKNLAFRLSKLNGKKLILVRVSQNHETKFKVNKIGSLFSTFNTVDISTEKFFTIDGMLLFLIGEQVPTKYFIFQFEEPWAVLLVYFRKLTITVSGGSNTKRHMLSPTQLRLAQFITCAEGMSSLGVVESFEKGRNIEDDSIKKNITQPLEDLSSDFIKENLHKIKIDSVDKELKDKNLGELYKKDSNILSSLQNSESTIQELTDIIWSNEEEDSNLSQLEKSINHKQNPFNSSFQKRDFHYSATALHRIKTSNINKSSINSKSNTTSNSKETNFVLSYLDSIEEIINNQELTPFQAQTKIENSWLDLVIEKLNDQKYLINRHSHRLSSKLKDANDTLNLLYIKKEIKKKFPLFSEDLNRIEFLLLTFSYIIAYHNRLKFTAISVTIGNAILFLIYQIRRKDIVKKNGNAQQPHQEDQGNENASDLGIEKDNNYITYTDFISQLKLKNTDLAKLGDFFISILSQFPHNIFERNFQFSNYFTGELVELKINQEYLDEIKENIIVQPSSLPMVCEPENWSDDSYGGFISNKEKGVSVITGTSLNSHTIENKDNLYKAINYLNSIKFGINNLLLDYLNNEGKYLLEEFKAEDDLQRAITLKVAQCFSKIPFYLNVHADWRGRIYTQSFFISYQGGDLSSALLNFWEGKAINEKGKYYLYIYGANNHNENNLSKSSFSDRILWVKNNYDKIINLDRDLISTAENKFIFAAFCLNMKEIHNNPKAIIKTPVFLDATCSGIQHLAALLQDLELGSHVNLLPKEETEVPGDIYTEITEPINKAINKYGEENLEYSNLSIVKFNRKILKQSIMTKVYNVSSFGISNQLKSKLEKITDKNNELTSQRLHPENNHNFQEAYSFSFPEEENVTRIEKVDLALKNNLKKQKNEVYISPGKDGKNVRLTSSDIFKIATIINEEIFVLYPSLNGIYSYLIEISKLMIKLDIPLTWITPTGLKITQRYLKNKQTTIAIKFAGKTKKMILRESTDITNKSKQTQAIIPNIIHSLDANHLINLINNAGDQNFEPIITIHDCFGTHPNSMGDLEIRVKSEFVLLYSQDNFLEKFHKKIIQSIIDNQYEITTIHDGKSETKTVLINDKIEIIPDLPKLGELDLKKINESRYFIS